MIPGYLIMEKCAGFFVTIILMLSLCLKGTAKECESPVYTQYVAEITSAFAKEMNKEFCLDCGASGGEMPYDVEAISIKLVSYQSATVEQARELEIKTTERLVQIINAHEKIRPFLRESPFPSSRARVNISFRNPKKTLSSSNDVALVLQAKNKIHYCAKDPNNQYLFIDIKEEPYEEARKIVLGNSAKNDSQ